MPRFVPAGFRSNLRRWVIVGCLAIALEMPGADLLGENHKTGEPPLVALIVANGVTARLSDDKVIANARSLANSLRDAGFSVTQAENTTDKKLERAFYNFIDTVPRDALAIVSFSGRVGIVNGQLVPFPVDMNPLGLPPSNHLSDLMSKLAAKDIRGALWLIDASYKPSVGKGSLRIHVPPKTIVAFSTMLHMTLPDERWFSGSLANRIRSGTSGLAELLEQTRVEVLKRSSGKQVPWELYNGAVEVWDDVFTRP